MKLLQQELLYDLKLNYKELSQYQIGLERLAHYRAIPSSVVPDIDRSHPVINIFIKQLNWLSPSYHNVLESDTYLISPYYLATLLLKASDSEYYVKNFKTYVIEDLQEDYENSTYSHIKTLRYKWLSLKSTQSHYKEVYENEVVNQLLSLSHSLANLNVIPYKMGGIKCIVYGEDPFATLDNLEINFESFKENFAMVGVESFPSYIDHYCFKCCYETNNQGKLVIKKELKDIYKFHSTDTFDVIIEKCKLLIELVKARSLEIQSTYA